MKLLPEALKKRDKQNRWKSNKNTEASHLKNNFLKKMGLLLCNVMYCMYIIRRSTLLNFRLSYFFVETKCFTWCSKSNDIQYKIRPTYWQNFGARQKQSILRSKGPVSITLKKKNASIPHPYPSLPLFFCYFCTHLNQSSHATNLCQSGTSILSKLCTMSDTSTTTATIDMIE